MTGAALALGAVLLLVQAISATPAPPAPPARAAGDSLAAAATATAAPLLRLSIDARSGYDDNLLADPERLGVLEPVSAALFTVGPSLRARRAGLLSRTRRDRCEAALEADLTGYSTDAGGPDRDLRADLIYQIDVAPRTLIEANASMVRFRRRALPVFDLDLPEVGFRLARAAGERWLAAGELGYARPSYPGRALDAGGHQRDERLEIAASLLRTHGARGYTALRSMWRAVDSNDPYVVHGGPVLELRAGLEAVRRLRLAASLAFGQRAYSNYPVLRGSGTGTIDTGETRLDRTWQLGFAAERSLADRASVYIEGLTVHQSSNVPALGFRQARILAGVHLDLWRAGSEDGRRILLPVPGVPQHPSAPQVRPDGVRFRHHAADARRVALVGGFNGWDENRDLLHGPDADGFWEITLPLPAGTWRYAFVVDGTWVRPEGAPRYEEDGFGAENGILDLDAPAGAAAAP